MRINKFNNLFFLLLLNLTFFSCNKPINDTYITGWKLIWQDEFNYPKENLTKNWTFEKGYGSNGWGNDEWQYYTNENAIIESGKLVITAKNNNIIGKRDSSITSSRMHTYKNFEFKPGTKIIARIKLPWGQGIWPAFWALGSNFYKIGWPSCGEIDILELTGGDPFKNKKNHTIHSTTHWNEVNDNKNYKHAQHGKHLELADSFINKYHIYELNYELNYIQTKIDGKEIFKIKTSVGKLKEPFSKAFFLILNVAVGGHWPGNPSNETIFPQKMHVDYIRAYQKL